MATMLVTDCPIRGCGREVGITKPLPEPGAILRTASHRNPAGVRCTPTQVAAAAIREVAGTPRSRARAAARAGA